jgi:hypothetical protein
VVAPESYRESKRDEDPLLKLLSLSKNGEGDIGGEVDKRP